MLRFDCVAMLTASNWFQELRSNRYHYAVRFAKHYPVIFIQADRKQTGYQLEPTEVPNIWVLHVACRYGREQAHAIQSALGSLGLQQPLHWIYNVHFAGYLYQNRHCMNVFHATEDYLSADSPIRYKKGMGLYSRLKACLNLTDLLICVSQGVADSYVLSGYYTGAHLMIGNGCDYAFYAQPNTAQLPDTKPHNIAFYQGNIFGKLDYQLLIYLAQNMPEWRFVFCGPVLFNENEWQTLKDYPNVDYLGVLSPEQIRSQAYQSTVGLIPFKQEAWLVKKSLPLKAFEYLACGLPVVSITIDALKPFAEGFAFSDTPEQFEQAMEIAAATRWHPEQISIRQALAQQQSYDDKFDIVHDAIEAFWENPDTSRQIASHWKLFFKWIWLTAVLRYQLKLGYQKVLQRKSQ